MERGEAERLAAKEPARSKPKESLPKKRLKRGETVKPEGRYSFEKIKERKLYETGKSGTIYLSVLISPLLQEGKEGPVGYLAQLQDTTDQKMMMEALRRERRPPGFALDQRIPPLR